MKKLSKWNRSNFGGADATIGLKTNMQDFLGCNRGINQNTKFEQIQFAHTRVKDNSVNVFFFFFRLLQTRFLTF